MRVAPVGIEKCIRAKENGRVDIVGNQRDEAIVQRRWVVEAFDTGEERHQCADDKAEDVEHRHRVHDHIAGAKIDGGNQLVAIG